MNVVLWVVAIVLALAFLGAGASKIFGQREKLMKQMPYVEDFPQSAIKAIGAAEVLGGLGLVLPALFDIATVLVPIAAAALAVLMVGGVATHIRRGDGIGAAVPALVLAVLSLFVAWGRFGPYAF